MYNYEIVLIIHPEKNEEISNFLEICKSIINKNNGKIHRIENWGCCSLAYPIKKINKAYYILFGIEVKKSVMQELEKSFKFSNLIIRNLILKIKNPITSISPIKKIKDSLKNKEII